MSFKHDMAKQGHPASDNDLVRDSGIQGRVWLGTLALLALVFGFGGWAATTELSGAVIGQGQVKVDKDLRAIQHLDGGILQSITVKKGDSIEEGQILLVLDDTSLKAEQAIIREQLVELSAKKYRLLAERDAEVNKPSPPSEDPLGVAASPEFANELRVFSGNLETRNNQVQQIKHGISQVDEELRGLDAKAQSNVLELKLVQSEYDRFEKLRKQGLVEASRVFAFARDLTKLKGESKELEASTARAQSHKSELLAQIEAVEKIARAEAQKQLSEIEPRLTELTERMNATAAKLSRLSIRAPIAGTVNEVAVNTVGGVITPAQKLLTIVPKDAALQIETHIQPTDIDQIYVSQAAKLRFTAFSARETPELNGTVSFVSPATTVEPSSGRAFYLAQIEVLPVELSKLSGKKLVPGMPVEVFAQTESRTVLSYLAKPLMDQFRRAFREN